MPILDPSLVFSLLNSYEKKEFDLSKRFFPYFLKVASDNLFNSSDTIEASFQFKKDLIQSIECIKSMDLFTSFSAIEIENNYLTTNYYQFVLDHLKDEYKSETPPMPQGYYSICDKYDISFFQILTSYPEVHAWFFSKTPIAILCIDSDKYSPRDHKYLFETINLEIDLLTASGLTIVLCLNLNEQILNDKMYEKVLSLIANHSFSEVHLGAYDLTHHKNIDEIILEKYQATGVTFPYIYFYGLFSKTTFSGDKVEIKQFYHPNFQYIPLSIHPKIAFKQIKLFNIDPFQPYYNGFCDDKIAITISNIPLYDDEKCLSPTETSGICIGSVSKDDFLYMNQPRISVYIENLFTKYYVNFEDIHLIRPDFYVEKTVFLSETSAKELETIDKLIKEISNDYFEVKSYDSNIFTAIFSKRIMLDCLKIAICAYTDTIKKTIPDFSIHRTQVLAILETCKDFIFNDKNKKQNGIIFQIDTGEGKSCITQIIAAVLSLMGETVHIISSNLNLSKRDYEDSLNFFRTIGKETAVLLHKNERKFESYDKLDQQKKDTFPKKYFHEDCFLNSLDMNINICDRNSNVKVIFSTLANFQYYYLYLMSKYPGYANSYFNNCFLLIDEADSILIDEITNGAILSHPIKTNSAEVLRYVYVNRKKKTEQTVLDEIRKFYPKCDQITLDDIVDMYNEIDIVNDENFSVRKKYILQKVNFEENDDLVNLYNKYKDDSIKKELRMGLQKMIDNFKNKKGNKTNKITLRKVVPYDCENKGMSEPNKEFSGFIQQFIAIKEKKKNENLIIEDLSMSYMYVSHPYFVKLYKKGVCGFTGTVGDKYEIDIYNKTYNLRTKIIPRENPNHRVDFPKIICKKEEKKDKILEEILFYHEKEIPVLVIFQNYNELKEFKKFIINSKTNISSINVFNGKKETIRPDDIAGVKGSVSIGTNVCGRGVDIFIYNKPLHIIVAYYTANSRIINQALGRTARQGNLGSTRIICSEEEFLSSKIIFDQKEINSFIDVFNIKKNLQVYFIEHFNETRSWIFSDSITKQILNNESIGKLRESLINVNRYKVCNYRFPICMSVETFLEIQIQKIFSLYNLPNCDNTWMIFQRYIREMIFYSLSLTLDNADKQFRLNKIKIKYGDYLDQQIKRLISTLQEYLPENNSENTGIIPTFMHIHNLVMRRYLSRAKQSIPASLLKINKQTNQSRFISLSVGFRPFKVGEDSGLKTNNVDGEDKKYFTIQDPELKFYQRSPDKKKIFFLSITKKVDQIFNEMCEKVNEVINNFIGLNFFLRRTLGGVEFGICYDFGIESAIRPKYDFLVDTDPLFLFSINVRSSSNAPILAGILIFCLVYIVKIVQFILNPAKTGFESLKTIINKIIDEAKEKVGEMVKDTIADPFKNKINNIFESIFESLINVVENQIKKLKDDYAEIFQKILNCVKSETFSNFLEKINGLFEGKTILNISILPKTTDLFPVDKFLKLGILLLLCISSFMMNFHSRCRSIKYDTEKVAQKFDSKQNVKQSFEENNNIITEEELKEKPKKDLNIADIPKQKSQSKTTLYSLDIVVIEAIDIPKMDIGSWCDPYVIISTRWNGEISRTKIIKNVKIATWNHAVNLKFTKGQYDTDVLRFKMKDWDKNSDDDYISQIEIPLNSFKINTPTTNWYNMTNPGKKTFGQGGGKLKISFNLSIV